MKLTEQESFSNLMIGLSTVMQRRPNTQAFLSKLADRTDFAFYGGALRDLLLFGPDGVTGDIDIVTSIDDDTLRKLIIEYTNVEDIYSGVWKSRHWSAMVMGGGDIVEQTESRGMFGGYKLDLDGERIDIWAFENTLELAKPGDYPDPWQALVDRTDFSCNCIAFVMNGQKMGPMLKTSKNYFEMLDARLIDINNPRSMSSDQLQYPGRALAARAVKQIATKKLLPTQAMADFLTDQLLGRR